MEVMMDTALSSTAHPYIMAFISVMEAHCPARLEKDVLSGCPRRRYEGFTDTIQGVDLYDAFRHGVQSSPISSSMRCTGND